MIERYSRPQMKRVWSDETKFDKWLKVEIAVCEAWAELGVIPREAVPKIKLARVNIKRMEISFYPIHYFNFPLFVNPNTNNNRDVPRLNHFNRLFDFFTMLFF